MFTLGYIVTPVKYRDLEEDIVCIVKDVSQCRIGVPRLIVGLSQAKKYAEDNGFHFDILDCRFPNGDMWTFLKTEKHEIYDDVVAKFKKKIVSDVSESVKYTYVDIYRISLSKKKKLISMFFSNSLNRQKNYIFISGNMLYMEVGNGNVIGISERMLSFCKIDIEKVHSRIKACSNNYTVYYSSNIVSQMVHMFKGKEYVIPYILQQLKQE